MHAVSVVNLTHGIVWGSSATFKATYIQLSNFGFSDGFVSAIHWRERLLPYLQQELQRVMQSMTRVKTPLVETLKQTLNIIFLSSTAWSWCLCGKASTSINSCVYLALPSVPGCIVKNRST